MVTTLRDDRRQRILAVIVLYQTAPEDSASYRTLLAAQSWADLLDLTIVLYDNSPGDVAPRNLASNTRYIPDASNAGLATAYNVSLEIAIREGYDWLLTLDQDTHLPPETFQLLDPLLKNFRDSDVAAIVPEIHASGRLVSPNYFVGGAWPRWFAVGFTGIPKLPAYAFNSGSVLRTSALRQIGGYNPRFWLDNSDSMLYRQLAKFGKLVYVAGQWKVDHDLAVLNVKHRVPIARYRTLLLAEAAFWDLEMSALAGLERTYRLLGRWVKHVLRGDDAERRNLTRDALLARLFRSRKQRIAVWEKATNDRVSATKSITSRPMVSVCVAAYNGELYVEAQLRSIIPQLTATDEIVIVDDASKDNTAETIDNVCRSLAQDVHAPRILFVRRDVNQGVVRTFEQATRISTGDILFLCDDDDLWAPDKVQKVLSVFIEQPHVDLVTTDIAMIDKNGAPYEDALFMKHRHSSAGFFSNIAHNQFQGSTMAFRATLLDTVLPFPANQLFLHDAWIGSRCAVAGKKVVFLKEPLLLYRRHEKNYSRHLDLSRKLRSRLQLLSAHVWRLLTRA
jgi:glycosyltransferase involved in cell wall biosynthesis